MRLRGKAFADALIAAFTPPPEVQAERTAIFDELYGMWRALPRDERLAAEWVTNREEFRRIDNVMGNQCIDIFNPTFFGRPVRLDPSAEGVRLIPGSLVAA